MNFLEFCKSRVSDKELIVDMEDIPDRYKKATDSMINIMKNKRDIFDKINVPFVEQAFDCDYEKILDDKLVDGEIPDGIIHDLSVGIFNDLPVDLSKDQQAIIKMLSTYICIQS